MIIIIERKSLFLINYVFFSFSNNKISYLLNVNAYKAIYIIQLIIKALIYMVEIL